MHVVVYDDHTLKTLGRKNPATGGFYGTLPVIPNPRSLQQVLNIPPAASADVSSLVQSALFSGGEGCSGSEAAAELRELILAVQDLTAERDEARSALEKLREASKMGDEEAELAELRAENAKLRSENANMFTLMEENSALRNDLEAARLQIDCMREPPVD